MITQKPCKGTGKAKGYGCGKTIDVKFRKYGLGLSCCYANWLYSSEEGLKIVNKTITKVTEPRKELERATVEKKQRTGLTTLIKSVVNVCHEYIRLRDKYKPCISCGTSWHKDFQAGHFKKAELFTTIKLHEHNINGQCPQCNLRKDGNEANYSIRLPLRIGQDNYNELVRLAELDHSISFKWDREKLKETRNYYKLKLKNLKNGAN